MKKRNGFTLVELIAVIILLAAIILISVPSIINTLKNSEEKSTESFENELKRAAELYVEHNRDLFPELDNVGGSVDIYPNTLINDEYLDSSLVNKADNTTVYDYIIKVEVGSDNIFIYTVKGV